MKVRFKKKRNPLSLALLALLGFVLVPIGVGDRTVAVVFFFIWISVIIALLYDYEISDKDRLKDYALSIDIHHIHKIVDDEKGVTVHYDKKEDGSIKTRRFTPKDKTSFIKKLKEINPNIQII